MMMMLGEVGGWGVPGSAGSTSIAVPRTELLMRLPERSADGLWQPALGLGNAGRGRGRLRDSL